MQIVMHTTKQRKPARRGHPALEPGTILYLIQYPDKTYFHYGYVLMSTANKVRGVLTGDKREREFNSVRDPENVLQAWNESSD